MAKIKIKPRVEIKPPQKTEEIDEEVLNLPIFKPTPYDKKKDITELKAQIEVLTQSFANLQQKIADSMISKSLIPVTDILSICQKYAGSKKRWKANPTNTEPDYLNIRAVQEWCNKL